MQNVMKIQRHAISATKEVQIATPLLSALLLAVNHTVSATQQQESVLLATQQQTKTALK
jgi:hypothetical protein